MASDNDTRRVEEIAREYGRLLKKTLDVRYVYLYGSYAKGTYTHDSDIDIAVVGDNFGGDPVEDTLMLMKMRRKIDTRIEPRPFNTKDFQLSNPLAKEIITTGIMVTL